MRRFLIIATAAAAAIVMPASAAQACPGSITPGPVYVTEDLNWAYVETNGEDGLQRGDGGTFDSTQVYSASDGMCQTGSANGPDSKIY